MKKSFFAPVLVCIFLFMGCQQVTDSVPEEPAALYKAQTFTYIIDDFVIYSSCAEEDISFSGVAREVLHIRVDNGRFHLNSVQGGTLTGTGLTTGNKYLWTGPLVQNYNLEIPSGGSYTYSLIWPYNLISQGQGGNLISRAQILYTINSNGEVTVDHEDWFSSEECR